MTPGPQTTSTARLRSAIRALRDPGASSGPEQLGGALAAAMVADGQTGADDLGQALATLLRLAGAGDDAERVHRMGIALVVEHVHLVRGLLLQQQEELHRAALTAQLQAEERRADSETRFSALFENAPVGIGIGDLAGRILKTNEALQRMFGFSADELAAREVQSFVHPDDAPGLWEHYERLVSGETDVFRTEKRYLRRDGSVLWCELSLSLIRDGQGAPTYQVAVIQDMSQRHDLETRLRHAATHDALTGLPNRRLLLEHLERATRTGPGGVVLCFLDIDNFKGLNDTWGHLVGDQVLHEVANRLAGAMRGTGGLLARFGGDEFVVLLGPGPADGPGVRIDAQTLAGRLLEVLEEPMQVPGARPVQVRASIGLVELPATHASPDRVLQAAELARRAAKQDGKGRVVRHDPNRTARQLTRVGVALSLPGVTAREELTLVYQPLVRLADGGLHGAEALVRWHHPELGPLLPDAFVPVAEETGEIAEIGDWVLDRACRDLASREAQAWPAVNINLSVHQLYRPGLVAHVGRCLLRHGLEPHRLRLELTESAFLDPGERVAVRGMRDLADLGVRLVLDDFGTGYSNLAALRRLPLHEIKLAASFVQGEEPWRQRVDRTILAAVVDLAHELGLTVTVEGVESAEQHRLALAVGCDVGQGWFYGPELVVGDRAEGPARSRAMPVEGRPRSSAAGLRPRRG